MFNPPHKIIIWELPESVDDDKIKYDRQNCDKNINLNIPSPQFSLQTPGIPWSELGPGGNIPGCIGTLGKPQTCLLDLNKNHVKIIKYLNKLYFT